MRSAAHIVHSVLAEPGNLWGPLLPSIVHCLVEGCIANNMIKCMKQRKKLSTEKLGNFARESTIYIHIKLIKKSIPNSGREYFE